jgi:hypothetical protein
LKMLKILDLFTFEYEKFRCLSNCNKFFVTKNIVTALLLQYCNNEYFSLNLVTSYVD